MNRGRRIDNLRTWKNARRTRRTVAQESHHGTNHREGHSPNSQPNNTALFDDRMNFQLGVTAARSEELDVSLVVRDLRTPRVAVVGGAPIEFFLQHLHSLMSRYDTGSALDTFVAVGDVTCEEPFERHFPRRAPSVLDCVTETVFSHRNT